MKNIKNIIILVFLLIMSSCSKSFIEKEPVSAVTIDVLYKTDKDYQDAIIGVYEALRNQYSNMWQFGDLRGDDAFINISNQPSSRSVDLFSINSGDDLLKNTWAAFTPW